MKIQTDSGQTPPPRGLPWRLAQTVTILLVLASGCVSGTHRSSSPGSESDAAAIREQSKRFSEAYVRGDIETLVSIYKDDGMAAPGGRDFIRGHDELHEFWSLPPGRTVLRHISTPEVIRIEGDQAFDWGTYEGQAANDGVPLRPFRGKYLIVWERDSDGRWRIAADMWNSLPSANE